MPSLALVKCAGQFNQFVWSCICRYSSILHLYVIGLNKNSNSSTKSTVLSDNKKPHTIRNGARPTNAVAVRTCQICRASTIQNLVDIIVVDSGASRCRPILGISIFRSACTRNRTGESSFSDLLKDRERIPFRVDSQIIGHNGPHTVITGHLRTSLY